MNSIDNLVPQCLDYAPPPPSINYLINCKIEFPKRGDIEDGLCSPDDQKLFHTASMFFLQNHLKRKLKTNTNSPVNENQPKRIYSDLLILENSPKRKRIKSYLRLKNIDKYDEISRNEANFSTSTLTLSQILPRPKKCAEHKSILGLFRRFSSTIETKSLEEKMQCAQYLFKNLKPEMRCANPVNWKIPPADSLILNRITMASSFVKPSLYLKGLTATYRHKEVQLRECEETTNMLTQIGVQTKLRERSKSPSKDKKHNFVSVNFTDELKFQYSSDRF